MSTLEIIQEMQMCLKCKPFFPRDKEILAHEIGLHVTWWFDNFIAVNGERKWFINTIATSLAFNQK